MFLCRITRKLSPVSILNSCRFSSSDLVKTQVDDKSGIAVVTMNRPPVNSLNLDMLREISLALDAVEKNKYRGMILTSSSNNTFCSGMDIMELFKPDQARLKEYCSALYDVWMKLFCCAVPTAAAINGHSLAAGCVMAISCEYRVMKHNFTIGLNEARLGIVVSPGVMLTMENVLSRRVIELAVTQGKLFSTEKALKIGLVDQVEDTTEEVMSKCEEFIKLFATVPQTVRSLTKQSFRQMLLLRMDREQDMQMWMHQVNEPKFQKNLELYIEGIKKKK